MSPEQTIGDFRVAGKLGEGGMGGVYRATGTHLNREVAIKVLPAAFAGDSNRIARFQREVQVLASLNRPNIAAIYGVERGAPIMELVEGPTLAERIAAGPIAIEETVVIVRQIADALEAATSKLTGPDHTATPPCGGKRRSSTREGHGLGKTNHP